MKQFLLNIWQYIYGFGVWLLASYRLLWRSHWLGKVVIVLLWLLVAALVSFYAVSQWYVHSMKRQPLRLGVTFVADQAYALGVDPRETYTALLEDLGVKNVRLVSYWNKHEPTPGEYDFTDLDWQFRLAEEHGAKVSLAIGLRQPRWPECHAPDWTNVHASSDWQSALMRYLETVVNRYKDSPALDSYQLENEYFLAAFGECPEPSRQQLQAELALVKSLDPNKPVIMSRSNNAPALMMRQPLPDIVGFSVYRRVWNDNIYRGYFNYPLPSWYYAGLAGWQKIFTGKTSYLHEMQMEPWPPNGQFIADVSREVQDESMNANMFAGRIDFAINTGMRNIDLWGAEWWYYRKTVLGDDSLWRAAQQAFDNHH